MELREVSMHSHSPTKKSASSPTDHSFQNLMNRKAGISGSAKHEHAAGALIKGAAQSRETSAIGEADPSQKSQPRSQKPAMGERMRTLSRDEQAAPSANPSKGDAKAAEFESEVKAEIADAKAEGTQGVSSESKEVYAEVEQPAATEEDVSTLLMSVLGASESAEAVASEETFDAVESKTDSSQDALGTLEEVTERAVTDSTQSAKIADGTTFEGEENRVNRQISNEADVRRDWDSERVLEFLDIRPNEPNPDGESAAVAEAKPSELQTSASESHLKPIFGQTEAEKTPKQLGSSKMQFEPKTVFESLNEDASEDFTGLKAEIAVQSRSEVQVHFENMVSGAARPVMTQVTEAVRANFATLASGQVVEIQLNPEQLGKVELKLHIHKGVIEAEIKVENQQVKSAIESSMAELKQSLSQRGYEVKDVSVSVDSDGQRGGSQNGSQQKQSDDAEAASFVELMEEEARKAKE